ncbi:hypothetical protein [Desulfosoma caldarium]|uniref:hypothetical protein n=1 Tax=Desulfosoma caldarium TaxID=610254 RepID=UPI000F46292D|nr:hypothetical protein [Desulfosoma caldarium]
MEVVTESSLFHRLRNARDPLTPNAKILCDHVMQHPRQSVFQRIHVATRHCGVCEAALMRCVKQLGDGAAREFIVRGQFQNAELMFGFLAVFAQWVSLHLTLAGTLVTSGSV